MKRVGAISLKRYALESAVAILNAFPRTNVYMVLVQRGQGPKQFLRKDTGRATLYIQCICTLYIYMYIV